MYGQGNFGSVANSPYSAGPPFPATAAENGLSIDPVTGRVVLGEDAFSGSGLATLLSGREIPMNGNTLSLTDNALNNITQLTANNIVIVDVATQSRAEMAAFNTGGFMAVESDSVLTAAPKITLTDVSTIPHPVTTMQQNGSTFQVQANSAPVNMLTLDQSLGLFKMGDIDAALNTSVFSIDDVQQRFRMDSGGNLFFYVDVLNNYFEFGQATTNNSLAIGTGVSNIWLNGGKALQLDLGTGQYSMGDVDGNFNSTTVTADDAGQKVFLTAGNGVHTSPPTGAGTDGAWLLGKVIAAAVALDPTQYVEVKIDGVVVKLAIAA